MVKSDEKWSEIDYFECLVCSCDGCGVLVMVLEVLEGKG